MNGNVSRFATPIITILGLFGATPLCAQSKIEYNRDVRPILAENCFACHGPDSAARKAKLRLDQRDDAIASGVIVPGNVKKSVLLERIDANEPKQIMPPPKSHKKL